MARNLFAGILALLAPLVDSAAEELFPTLSGSNTLPVAWVMVALYLAVGQYLVARKGLGFSVTLPTVIAMAIPPVVLFMAQIELTLCCLLGTLLGAIVASMV